MAAPEGDPQLLIFRADKAGRMEFPLFCTREQSDAKEDEMSWKNVKTPRQPREVAPRGQLRLVPRRDPHQLDQAARDVASPPSQHHLHWTLVDQGKVKVPPLGHPNRAKVKD